MSTEMLWKRSCDIYIDEEKNLIFTTKSSNPAYDKEIEAEKARIWQENWKRERGSKNAPPYVDGEPKYLTSQKMIELRYPYTLEEIAEKLQEIFNAWDLFPPVKDKVRDAIEIYYGIKNFKKASYGKRMLYVFGNSYENRKEIILSMPCKTPRMWMGIETVDLPLDADWLDFARVIMDIVEADVTQYAGFKQYKRMFNLTPPKPREKKTAESVKE